MANQVVVTQSGNVQVSIQPTPNVQVQVSRAAITTLASVANANYANFAGEVVDSSQPNITSLGTLTSLTSSGNITAPYFIGNVVGNISGNIVVPGTNTSVLFNDAGVAGASDAFQFNKSSNTVTVSGNLSATNISGNGAGLSNIAGANVTGQVSYAAVANSVSGSNVSGAVAYATTANSVAGGNVSGQVAYAAVANSIAGANVTGAVNLATYATTANSVAGANVTGTVANATHATVADSANSVAGSNVSGQVSYAATANSVALANVVGAGNIASINIDGNGGNVLYGNGIFAAVVSPTSVANANYSNFAGNVVNSAQPNITSLGSLTGLVVAGDATVTGNLAVDGNLTYVNVTNLVVQDPVIEMGGGPNGAPLTTNDGRDRGSLLHYYTTQPVDAFMGWDNSNGEFGFGSNVTNTNDVMTFNSYGNVRASTFIGDLTGTASHATVADSANSVAGANVSGAVNLATYATTANAVAGANVSGQVSYAAVANSVAGANVSGDVSGSNHANVADVANSVSGSNVSGAVNLANYATTANSVAGANVAGEVAYAAVANSVSVANVSGIGNIATVNLDGNVSNALLGNGSWGPVEVQSTSIANGTSNVSIPVANGNINASVNGNANVVQIDGNGSIFVNPLAGGYNNLLRFNNYGRSGNTGASRISSFRYRGNSTANLSVQPNDDTMEFLTLAYNGAGLQTSSVAVIRARVDASYTANGANIPLGWQVVVNDTNGGVNNQNKTHNFYSNGNTSLSGALTIDGGSVVVSKNGGASPANVTVSGDGTTSSSFYLANVGFSVNWSNVDTSSGYSPFRFDQITSLTNEVGVIRNFRARGTSFSNISAVTANDYVYQQDYGVYGDAGNTYLSIGGSSVVVTGNDGAGNVPANLTISAGSGLGQSSSNIIFNAGNTQFNGNVTATNATLGNLATANYFTGDGGLLSNIAVANVTGLGNIATVNLDGNVSNILHGDGSWGPESETGNANYAAYAGNVTIAAQSNITSLGNLVSLTVKDSNTSNPSAQFVPTGNVVGVTSFSNSFIRIDQYNDLGNANGVQNLAFVKSRGTSASPTATANNDTVLRLAGHVFNGNTYPKAFQISVTAPQAANANFQLANTVYTPGSMAISTGNPFGNVANTNATSALNTLAYNQNGTLALLTGSPTGGTTAPPIVITTYGYAANAVGAAGLITTQRARGNRDGNLAVDNGDQLGGIGWNGYNGNAFFTTRFAQIRANVNTAHGTIANGASVPTDLQFVTCSNTTGYTTYFYGNGSASFPGAVSISGNASATGNITGNNINITNQIYAGNSVNIVLNNVPTVNPSFGFSTYNDANGLVNPYTFYRARGNLSTPAAVVAGDAITSQTYNLYADSGNAYISGASTSVTVLSNDGAGNVPCEFNFTASKISFTGNSYPTTLVLSKFNETVHTSGSASGTLTPDLSLGSIHRYTLTGNITMNSLANVATGSSATIILIQDGTGGRTLTSSMLFAGGSKTLSTAANAVDIVSVFYDGTTYYATLSKGYA